MTIIDDFLADTREHMTKSVEATRSKFGSVRTGRASPALLDRIVVDYYGAMTPLKQLATVSAPEARLLTVQPYDKKPAAPGNGTMLAFEVGSPAEVDSLYRKALELGGTDEGPPGDRGDGYYGAYFRDLDGNKLNFHCWT